MNFIVRPPAIVEANDGISLNELLNPLGFKLLVSNKGALVVVGEGFRQEAISAIYSYFSAKRKRSQGEDL